MTRTLVYCRRCAPEARVRARCRPRARPRQEVAGYTLLEILFVVALLALVTSLALPLASRWLEGAAERRVVADVRALVRALPAQALLSGQALHVDAARLAEEAALAEGTHLAIDPPMLFAPDGTTRGGTVRLRFDRGREITFQVTAPLGETVVIDAP